MHVFIAGIMQAIREDRFIESQDYRVRLTQVLQAHVPNVEITDPWALNPNSVNYDDEQARHTFVTMTKRAADADVLLAYLPVASMGTAMEMWEAYHAGAFVVAVTPFKHHWAMKFTSDEIMPDLDTLVTAIENGRIHDWARKRVSSNQ
ncbi:MAG: hypothetical protein GY943_23195 [Chloroflexi bacterium]|nr:hypothetical protein [Chloroflexota bacterium]